MEYDFSLEWHQQFFPIVQGWDQCQLDCAHNREVTQKIHQVLPINRKTGNSSLIWSRGKAFLASIFFSFDCHGEKLSQSCSLHQSHASHMCKSVDFRIRFDLTRKRKKTKNLILENKYYNKLISKDIIVVVRIDRRMKYTLHIVLVGPNPMSI